MNDSKDTAQTPNPSLMRRLYCPPWCASHDNIDLAAHNATTDEDGITAVEHPGRVLPFPQMPAAALSMRREVLWDSEGTLIHRADTFLVRETILRSHTEIEALADALHKFADVMKKTDWARQAAEA